MAEISAVAPAIDQAVVLAEINEMEVVASDTEQAASDLRWEQSAKVVDLLENGMTQQAIADKWLKKDGTPYSQQHVSFVKKAHESFYYLGSKDRPTWNEAYHSDAVRKSDKGAHVGNNSGENEWYTPVEYIDAARAVMGTINLDPASTATANKIVQAELYFTEADNGLEHAWFGNVWMNPPYAQPLIGQFAEKAAKAYIADEINQACILVNNATETAWFNQLGRVSNAVCFPSGRVRFWHPDRVSAPLQGQAVIYLGEHVDSFDEHFRQFGLVFRR